MRQYYWKTNINEAKYVDCNTGSDTKGNGTQQNPYRTISKCGSAVNIVFRGVCSENLTTGNHTQIIYGDEMGAAVYDGQNKYMIYGYGFKNVIIKNVPAWLPEGSSVSTSSKALAGVGRANNADHVGYVAHVVGLWGSPAVCYQSPVYFGCVGGNGTSNGIVYSKPKHNSEYPIWMGGQSKPITQVTLHGCNVSDRQISLHTSTKNWQQCIFADFAIILNDYQSYDYCLFTADTKFYIFLGQTAEDGYYEAQIDWTDYHNGTKSMNTLIQAYLTLEFARTDITISKKIKSTFGSHCVYSKKTTNEIFNNYKLLDFTLRPDATEAYLTNTLYFGAFGPCLNIPFLKNSQGVPSSWDENTITGFFTLTDDENVQSENHAILAIDESSESIKGTIKSKIIEIDPTIINFKQVHTLFQSQFNQNNGYILNKIPTYPQVGEDCYSNLSFFGQTYSINQEESQVLTLTKGKYQVRGLLTIGGVYYKDLEIYDVTSDSVEISINNTDPLVNSKLIQILDPNINNVIYVRCRKEIYASISSGDGLQQGGVYYNNGEEDIIYRNKIITSGESFIAVNSTDTFTCPQNESYQIGILFDDTRVPKPNDWVPAALAGEYFVSKDDNGNIEVDERGIPYSSGNLMSFQTLANGGWSERLNKSNMDKQFIQLMIVAHKC